MSVAPPTATRRANDETPRCRPSSESRARPPTNAHVIPRSIPAAMAQMTPPTRTGWCCAPDSDILPEGHLGEGGEHRPDRGKQEAHGSAVGPRQAEGSREPEPFRR